MSAVVFIERGILAFVGVPKISSIFFTKKKISSRHQKKWSTSLLTSNIFKLRSMKNSLSA